MRALLLENINARAAALLAKAGYQVETVPYALSEPELAEAVRGLSLLGIRSGTRVTEAVLAAGSELLAVGVCSIGTSHVDLVSASRTGVAVFNAPFSSTRSVVELAIAEIIALSRRLPDLHVEMQAGVWGKSAEGVHELHGRTLGIVGYGGIGAQLSVIAEAFGLTVYFYDVADRTPIGNARRCSTLAELLEQADIVSVHVDGDDSNRELFGDAEFAAMRPRSLFLNLSRGMVVNHRALRRHVESGHIAGAAIDVFPAEPKRRGDEFASELRGLPNVILTPHIGGSTEEAQARIADFVAGKLTDYVATGATTQSVNLPWSELPLVPGAHRLTHLYKNVPGALEAIDRVLAEHEVSVEGRSLGTRDDLGYALTDLGAGCGEAVVRALRQSDITLRLRRLS